MYHTNSKNTAKISTTYFYSLIGYGGHRQADRQTNRHLLLYYRTIFQYSEEINLLHLKYSSTPCANQDGQYSKEFCQNDLNIITPKKTVNIKNKYVIPYTTVYILANNFTNETEIIKYITELICLT